MGRASRFTRAGAPEPPESGVSGAAICPGPRRPIVTFLMVFLIQNTQNRDGAAIQTKLDELIQASAAQNVYICIEHLTDEELDELRLKCETRARAEIARARATRAVQEKAAQAADRVVGAN